LFLLLLLETGQNSYMIKNNNPNLFNAIVIVTTLGYFVDVYDLVLFGIVKDPSLKELGIAPDQLFSVGNYLLRMQMLGMLLGGIVWGVLGDKKGRLSTLFLTILLYSLANIANGFVQNVDQYAWLRLIAGFGLAGELGVGITLVSEVMSKESRGMGTSIVAGIGILGAIAGFYVAETFNWKIAYWVGGGLGLILLILRVAVYESGMFEKTKSREITKGNFFSLLNNIKNFRKYIVCILVGIPVWYTISVLTINSAAFAKDALHIVGTIKGATAVMLHYVGASMGSVLFGYISQKLKSRRKTIFIALITIAVFTGAYFLANEASAQWFYFLIFALGIPMGGLWTVFITTASEQFGTNIRATVTTSAPNFVRGSTILVTLYLDYLKPSLGLWSAGLIVGSICIGIAFVAAFMLEETYGKDLDYTEPE
jgi:putative MFS transporter